MAGTVAPEPEAIVVDASVLAAYEMCEVTRVKCRNRPGETGATIEQFQSARGLPITLYPPEWPDLATFDRRLDAAARRIAEGPDARTD
jgi:hypothetical protein